MYFELSEKYKLHSKDTGSVEYQIILLAEEIAQEKTHLAQNKKDIPAKRAMLKKIARQRRLYRYLARKKPEVRQELERDLKKV